MADDLISIYCRKVGNGNLRHDTAQIEAAGVLENLRLGLEARDTRRRSFLSAFSSRSGTTPIQGCYLWGDVGSGKSMLMDLFFAATRISRKRRVHFHAFMQDVHASLDKARKQDRADPLDHIASVIAKDVQLLCFDELQITDIADAMIIGRLFQSLFGAGVTIVATSNRFPDDLYADGLNRALFLPFIEILKERLIVHHLLSELDHRRVLLQREQTWFCPLGQGTRAPLEKIWQDLTHGREAPLDLTANGRDLTLKRFHGSAARATFAELCEEPLGPADYLAIASTVRLLVLEDIPCLSREKNNAAKRFTTL
ncbi:MAG: cell division protein ZapE, partial [Paracoccaceae bacterium]